MITVWLFVSGNYFITKVSYVEGRGEQRSMEHDVLMLVRRQQMAHLYKLNPPLYLDDY